MGFTPSADAEKSAKAARHRTPTLAETDGKCNALFMQRASCPTIQEVRFSKTNYALLPNDYDWR
jgi:hypothetical protein